MSFSQLTGRSPKLPLSLNLADQSVIELQEWLRVLPGKRYVARGVWQGRQVVIKLFIGTKASASYLEEAKGISALSQLKIPTAKVLQQHQASPTLAWVVTQYLESCESLEQAWQAVAQQPYLSDAQEQLISQVLVSLAEMHQQGLWQDDLHLDNFLRIKQQLYVIDAGSIKQQTLGQPLDREQTVSNLALFFAQLPSQLLPYLEQLLVHYILTNSTHALPIERLQAEITKIRGWRLKDYLKKTARDCSLFRVRRSWFRVEAVWRQALPKVRPVLKQPDEWLARAKLYKDGGTAKVGLITQRNSQEAWQLVIKRYHIKNWKHWLSRFWRPSRAWHSWQAANRLEFLGIATPKPIAAIEQRWFGLRGPAWFISEPCSGKDIIAHFANYVVDGTTPPESMLVALDQLFAQLIREKISHGDLKGHNIFWQNNQWYLIDLDAMQQHRKLASFTRAYAKDRARFLRNWPAESTLYQLLDQRLPQVETLSDEL